MNKPKHWLVYGFGLMGLCFGVLTIFFYLSYPFRNPNFDRLFDADDLEPSKPVNYHDFLKRAKAPGFSDCIGLEQHEIYSDLSTSLAVIPASIPNVGQVLGGVRYIAHGNEFMVVVDDCDHAHPVAFKYDQQGTELYRIEVKEHSHSKGVLARRLGLLFLTVMESNEPEDIGRMRSLIYVHDWATGHRIAKLRLPSSPEMMAISRDETKLYIDLSDNCFQIREISLKRLLDRLPERSNSLPDSDAHSAGHE